MSDLAVAEKGHKKSPPPSGTGLFLSYFGYWPEPPLLGPGDEKPCKNCGMSGLCNGCNGTGWKGAKGCSGCGGGSKRDGTPIRGSGDCSRCSGRGWTSY